MTEKHRVTLGLEEEVFVLEKDRLTPTLQSLDYLRKLYWKNPRKYTTQSASNFAKSEDRRECFMGSVEISTGKHTNVDRLLEDLVQRRKEFAEAARGGLIVPVGGLFTLKSPSNTASSHIHVGVSNERRDLVYDNLAYFTPVLAVAAANSPLAAGEWTGLSYRMSCEGLLGPLREDREYRFQDLIISKRLGTIEMRVFDPMPEVWRLREILLAIQAIARTDERFPFDREVYNEERKTWTVQGCTPHVERLWRELQPVYSFSEELIRSPLSDLLGRIARQGCVEKAYLEADRIWREPTDTHPQLKRHSKVRTLTGLAGYYAIRLPYMAYKGYKEWYGKT